MELWMAVKVLNMLEHKNKQSNKRKNKQINRQTNKQINKPKPVPCKDIPGIDHF